MCGWGRDRQGGRVGFYPMKGGPPTGTSKSRLELERSELERALDVTNFTYEKTEAESFSQGQRASLSYKMVEDELALFDKSINEFWNKFKSTVSDTSCQMVGLRDTYKDSIKAFAVPLSLSEKLSVKLKEEERMVEMFLEYQNQICRQNKLIQEKKDNLLKLIAEVKGKKQELEALTANIQDLKEEYARKKETISSANKANEERLKRLQKSAVVYKDRLGLEIRKIYGDKLQFIFTNIDPKHPESPFMFSLCLNEARDYEVTLLEFRKMVLSSLYLCSHLEAFIADRDTLLNCRIGSLMCPSDSIPILMELIF
ncbi:kinetochore protein Spc25 isoform X1 [Camelus ferus]|uniref:Kinetochore protein SPC25 n=1 Tax=Camelus ferus TaxID=419612 RepID=A0A8B8SZS7_CAMFR|nr:kinetochore protein Spc25 isoform X1 [Camelus ferus]